MESGERADGPAGRSSIRLKLTAAGLAVTLIAATVMLLGMLGVVGVWVSPITSAFGVGSTGVDPRVALVGGTLVGLGVLLCGLCLWVIGLFFCLAVPARAGRAWVLGAFGATMSAPIFVAAIVMDRLPSLGGASGLVFVVAPMLIGTACLTRFLQKLALFIEHDTLIVGSGLLLKTLAVVVILSLSTCIPLAALGAVIFLLVYLVVAGHMVIALSRR